MRTQKILDGIWNFAFSEMEPDLGKIRFADVLSVPGCFDVAAPYFGRRGYGVYRRSVESGGLVKLAIDGIGISGKVFWDGREIGELKYAYMPEEFIFDAGKKGSHEIAVMTCNLHNKIFYPFYDFYGYGGIFGSVTLEELPELFIRRVRISTTDYRTGSVRLRIEASEKCDREILLRFDDGNPVAGMLKQGCLDAEFRVPDFRLWTPGTPNIHLLRLTLGNDEIVEEFGIREVRTDGAKLLLNGEELRLMGYNRHESHPYFGAASPLSLMTADLQFIRAQGCNFIRGSHYPQRRSFLKLCDHLGMLVWEETLGWDVKPPDLLSGEFLDQQLDQARKLTRASFNHPCIIIRGFLNETESQMPEVRPIIKALYDAIRAEDELCLITFASNKYEKDCCTDLVDIIAMNPYPGWCDADWDTVSGIQNIRPRFQRLVDSLPSDKPYMISETGGSAVYGFHDPFRARWSEEYQAKLLATAASVALNDPRYCGLAVWQFCDAKSYINGYVGGRPRGFNDKGVCDEYRRPKMAWAALRECIVKSEYLKHNGGVPVLEETDLK